MIDEAVLEKSLERRLMLAEELRFDIDKRAAAMALCTIDINFWFNHFVWTFDPRLASEGKQAWLPFDLFPRQEELIIWLNDRVEQKQEGVVEKSRDIGWTWVAAGYALNRWLFLDGFKTTFGSRKEMYVDKIGDPDSIFEKIRMILDRLPIWMLPEGFKRSEHDNYMRLINPANKNVISGEAGENMGRGGRSTLYVVDEGAYIEQADSVNAAIVANADCRIWASSANGVGNLFHRKRMSGHIPVFRYHWRDDPRKNDAWAEKKKKELSSNPSTWAAEYDIDYATSQPNVCIPQKWVQSSQLLYKMIKSGQVPYTVPETGTGGLDVGAGKALSVLVPKFGIMVEQPTFWQQVDNIQTTYAALDKALDLKLTRIVYDATGVGNTVTSTLNHVPEKYEGITTQPLNAGTPPEDVIMPDDRKAEEWFRDIKIQIWWRAREIFQKTHEYILYTQGDPDGVPHELHELIALCDSPEIAAQLSLPLWFKNENGLLILESKKQLAKRGVASPDHADAFVLNLAQPDHSLLFTSY